MEQSKRGKSADEQQHNAAGSDTDIRVVYDNQPKRQQQQAEESREQDEGLDETFPASDVPAPSDPTSAPAPAPENA